MFILYYLISELSTKKRAPSIILRAYARDPVKVVASGSESDYATTGSASTATSVFAGAVSAPFGAGFFFAI